MKIEAEPPRPGPEWPAPQSSEPARPFIEFLAEPEPPRQGPEWPAPPGGEPAQPSTDVRAEPEPPRPGTEWPAPQSGEPARSLTEFLAEPESRAARFTDFGMFGLSRAVAAPPTLGSGGNPAPDPQVVPAPLARGTAPLTISETPLPAADFLDSGLASGKPATCELPGPAPVKPDAGKPCALPGDAPETFVPETRDRADPEAPVRPNRTRPRPPPQRPGVNLTLHEVDGAVEIIAGAPPIDPQTRAQLRRLIEAILARNGLSLAQFQLNGAPLAPDLSGRRGGTYGTRTR